MEAPQHTQVVNEIENRVDSHHDASSQTQRDEDVAPVIDQEESICVPVDVSISPMSSETSPTMAAAAAAATCGPHGIHRKKQKTDDAIIDDPVTEASTEQEQPYQVRVSAIPSAPKIATKETTLTVAFDVHAKRKDGAARTTHPIDVVVVLDTSWSMDSLVDADKPSGADNPSRLARAIEATNFIANQLTENDRMCVVTFSTNAKQLTGLWCMSPTRKTEMAAKINALTTDGDTHIELGMETAITAYNRQHQHNPRTNFILLTDGRNSNTLDPSMVKMWNNQIGATGVIHTIGFGSMHDVDLCSMVAKTCRGTYSFVGDSHYVGDAIAKLLGSMTTIVANSVTVSVVTNTPLVTLDNVFSDFKTFPTVKSGVVITIPDIAIDETKSFIATLRIGRSTNPTSSSEPVFILKTDALFTLAPHFSSLVRSSATLKIQRTDDPIPDQVNPVVSLRLAAWHTQQALVKFAQHVRCSKFERALGEIMHAKSIVSAVSPIPVNLMATLDEKEAFARAAITRTTPDADKDATVASAVASSRSIGIGRATYSSSVAVIPETSSQSSQSVSYEKYHSTKH